MNEIEFKKNTFVLLLITKREKAMWLCIYSSFSIIGKVPETRRCLLKFGSISQDDAGSKQAGS